MIWILQPRQIARLRTLCLFGTFVFVLWFKGEAVTRLALGRATLLEKQPHCQISVNGILSAKACCFIQNFSGGRRQIVLWLPNDKAYCGREILVISCSDQEVGQTNSGDSIYQLYFDRWLYRSDSGYAMVYFSDAKSCGEKTGIQWMKNGFRFTLPKEYRKAPSAIVEVTSLDRTLFTPAL